MCSVWKALVDGVWLRVGGFAAERLRDKNIPLTVTVDKVAASGGYMMACVAAENRFRTRLLLWVPLGWWCKCPTLTASWKAKILISKWTLPVV
ncbi:S49 family peptidase [Escherichia coli]